jgi:hypothetical protein
MNGPRPKYSNGDKRYYLAMCRKYNAAAKEAVTHPVRYLRAAFLLHGARAKVPQRWRSMKFITDQGT